MRGRNHYHFRHWKDHRPVLHGFDLCTFDATRGSASTFFQLLTPAMQHRFLIVARLGLLAPRATSSHRLPAPERMRAAGPDRFSLAPSQDESYTPFATFSFDGVLGLALDSMAQATLSKPSSWDARQLCLSHQASTCCQSNEFSVMSRLHGAGVLK